MPSSTLSTDSNLAFIEVLPVDDALEPWFSCVALSDEDVATTLMVFEESLKEAKH